MAIPPSNVVAPTGWRAETIGAPNYTISFIAASSNLLAPGGSISGFEFDSPLTPAQLMAPPAIPGADGDETLTSIVFEQLPFSDAGFPLTPTISVGGTGTTPISAAASILPGTRSAQAGATATVFASFENTGSATLKGCSINIALPNSALSNFVSMTYQTTDPLTNALTGTPNTPVDIDGGNTVQTFLLAFSANGAFETGAFTPNFSCAGTTAVLAIPGVNTVDLQFSSTPTPDIIALAATASPDGIVNVPVGGTAAFAVASANLGAAGTIIVSADTNGISLPVSLNICQTTAAAACMQPPAPTVTLSDASGATPTFSVFVNASSAIPLDPATSRIFVHFCSGVSLCGVNSLYGLTSVAVQAH
jgi:hypothetical protein